MLPPARDPKTLAFTLFARLQPTITHSQADARLRTIWPHILKTTVPEDYTGARHARFFSRNIRMDLASTGISFLRTRFNRPLHVLQATAGIILCIACLNLANLFLAKAAAARHQCAVQMAIGASKWDLMRPRLMESLLLSVTGGLAGILLAYWAANFTIQTAWTGYVATPLSASLDRNVLAFTTAICVGTSILFGIAPALYAARADPADALKRDTQHAGAGLGSRRFLLVVQIAMSVVLVTAALLFARTLHALRTQDAGYRRDHLLTLVLFPQSGVSYPKDLLPYYERLADKVRHLPGVQGVSYSEGGPANEFEWFSPVSLPSGAAADAVDETVAPGFFSVAGMRVLAGREFSWSDAHHPARLAVISQSLSDRLFEGQNPLGRTVQVGPAALKRDVTIVGVVNSASLWKVETYHPMAIYLPFGQARQEYEPILDVRTTEDPGHLKQVIERVIHGFGYHDSIRSMTVEERLESYITVQRLTSLISTFFGALALLIVCVGVYGLTAFNVAGRTHELGIRSALGARRTQLIRLILQESMLLAGIGCACGLAASSLAARWIRALVFGISPMSPAVLLPALLGLLAVALIAAFLPSWRASNSDPMSALRSE